MAGVLCNGARLVQAEVELRVEGDPTEGALLTSASKARYFAGSVCSRTDATRQPAI